MKSVFRKIISVLTRIIDTPLRIANRFLDGHRLGSLDRFGAEYFTMRTDGEWAKDTMQICELLYKRYRPSTVVDWGCGNGIYLDILQRLGVKHVKGYDGSKTAIENSLLPEVELADLRNRIITTQKYDLILCIEVAPYLHEKYENCLIDNICATASESSVIVFTASDKYKGGYHHINLKSQQYWIDKFLERGFHYIIEDTNAIKAELNLNTLVWIIDNIILFKRSIIEDI